MVTPDFFHNSGAPPLRTHLKTPPDAEFDADSNEPRREELGGGVGELWEKVDFGVMEGGGGAGGMRNWAQSPNM